MGGDANSLADAVGVWICHDDGGGGGVLWWDWVWFVIKAGVGFIYSNGMECDKQALKHVSRIVGLLDSGEERRGELTQVQSPWMHGSGKMQ